MRERGLEDALSVALHLEQQAGRRDNSFVRISSIGECRRKIGYRITDYRSDVQEPMIWAHALQTFDIGHGIHIRLQQRLSNSGPMKWIDAEPVIEKDGSIGWRGNCEIPLENKKERIFGHCDGLTRPLVRTTKKILGKNFDVFTPTDEDDPSGKRYLLDIKSISSRDRVKYDGSTVSAVYKSPFEKITSPKPEHIQQVSMYAWLTTQEGFKTDRISSPLTQIPDVMIIYIGKDLDMDYYGRLPKEYDEPEGLLNSPTKVFTLKVDTNSIEASLTKVRSVWSYLDKKELPPRDYYHTPKSPCWECRLCQYNSKCYKEEGWFDKKEDLISLEKIRQYNPSSM